LAITIKFTYLYNTHHQVRFCSFIYYRNNIQSWQYKKPKNGKETREMIILIDQDGPLADFEGGFLREWKSKFPELPYIPLQNRRYFYIRDDYPSELRDKIEGIYFAPGFYRNLPLISGSVEVIKKLIELGNDVRICSSPSAYYQNCVLEKYQWVEQNLGLSFTEKVIFTRDKTIIRGDILLDDKPEIRGAHIPSWEHIVFAQPYNQRVPGKRRATWKEFLQIVMDTDTQITGLSP